MHQRNYLFSSIEWHAVEQHQRAEIAKEIDRIEADRLLNSSVEDLSDYFNNKYYINVPLLNTENIVTDQHESKIDISADTSRYSGIPGRPQIINGTTIEFHVPFEGDYEAFKIRPTIFAINAPCADVVDHTLIIEVQGTDLSSEQVRDEFDRIMAGIERNLSNLRNNAKAWNAKISTLARTAIEQRRSKLLRDRDILSGLGFKIKVREGESRTFTAPNVQRRIEPSLLPVASAAPYKPEPTLGNNDYEHILKVIQNMVHVMERSPSAFTTMDEESIRAHFLVQLNGHYEGQATGETFNYEGKTDILIRSAGKNIFIAECKFWSGPKRLIETIDQLLSYSSWRDTKVAVIIFNRNKDFTKVLEAIQETTKSHSNYKKRVDLKSETMFRFVFAHKDDKNRELLLTVMAFDVPV